MAKIKISPTPLRQIYFGQKPTLIEKNLKAWLKDPKLEQKLTAWFAENAKVMDENNSLKVKLKDKDQEINNLKAGFGAERINWANERTKLQNQTDTANASRDDYLQRLEKSYKFAKDTYHYLGNYGSNFRLLENLDQLKQLLKKHNKPTKDKDYYTLYDLVKMSKSEFGKLRTELEIARQKKAGIIPMESWETPDGLDRWIKELEEEIRKYENKPKGDAT